MLQQRGTSITVKCPSHLRHELYPPAYKSRSETPNMMSSMCQPTIGQESRNKPEKPNHNVLTQGLSFAFWRHAANGASTQLSRVKRPKMSSCKPRQGSNDDVGGIRLIPNTHTPDENEKSRTTHGLKRTSGHHNVRLSAQECGWQLNSRCGDMDKPTERSDTSTVGR